MNKDTEYGSERKTAEKPRWDNWHVRLPNPKDQQKAIDLFQRSGAQTKSDFVRGRILGESFKVITVDKSAVEYYRKLSELTAQIHKIGVLYNQTVRAINSYHSIKTAQILLEKLEHLSDQIITLQEQAISLTIDYRKKMIAKISATENLGGALGYNFKKVEKREASILLAQGLFQNKEGTYTMAEVFADMQAVIPEKCRTKKMVFHCSLNPHPDDKISDEQLVQVAREYMEALGYGKQPYIVFKHNDIAREHIHIVSLRVDFDGNKINDKFEGRRSKKITNALEKKYNLIPSSKVSERTTTETPKVNVVQGNIKEQVANTVRSAMKHYTFCSLGELNAVLRKYNLAVEEVKTEYRGKQYDGLVYVPTDDKGNKVSTPIHASDIGRGVGYTAVQNKMLKSKQMVKPLIPTVRRKVLEVMRTSPHTEERLRQRLEKQGLQVVIRKNDNGRIYGITFIDDEKGIALNGSRLGKGYAANKFNEYFSNPENNPFLDESLYGKIDTTFQQQMQTIQSDEQESDNLVDEFIDNMVGESFSSSGNDDWKEAAWQRKLRKQSKVKLKRRKR